MLVARLVPPKQTIFWIILILILWGSVGLSGYRIGEPIWESGHHGFLLTQYGQYALNFVRFGYLDTKFAMVSNYGEVRPPDGFDFYMNHGNLTALFISLAYRVFGVHEWSARLIALLLSTGTAVVTFFLSLHITGNRWSALLALFFCGFSPMQIFYGRLVAPDSLSIFFSMLVFLLYWLWLTANRVNYLYGMFIALVCGMITDWIAFFVVVPILAHYLIFHHGKLNWRFVITLVLTPVLFCVAFILWAYWLGGTSLLRGLGETFLFRTISVGYEKADQFTLHHAVTVLYIRSIKWLTKPVVILSLGWFVSFVWALIRRKVSATQGLILALFLFGFSHDRAFSNLSIIHDFVMMQKFVPVFAIVAASALSWVVARLSVRSNYFGVIALVVICYLFVKPSLALYRRYHHRAEAKHLQSFYVGRALNETISELGSYIDASNIAGVAEFKLRYVADRPFTKATEVDEVMKIVNDNPAYEAVVMSNLSKGPLRSYLVEQYPRKDVFGYSIFTLDQKRSSVLVNNASPATPCGIRFGNQIEFLGFDVERVVYRKDGGIRWLDKYLSRYPELLPRYRTAFHVANYWRKLTEDTSDHTLVTQFDAELGQPYRLEQSYAGLDDLYPTSLWPVGQVVREEFEIYVRPDYPSLKYEMWVGVKNGDNYLPPEESKLALDRSHRIKVGEVDIRPSR